MGIKKRYKYSNKTGRCEEIISQQRAHFHFVQEDTTEIESPITGEKFDSMSRYKQHIKNEGYEITGSDAFTGKGLADFNPKDVINEEEMRDASKKAVNDARWNMMPCSEKDKQIWIEEKRMMEGKSNNLREVRERGLKEVSQRTGVPISELREQMKRNY